jgi:tetratricopeptide (TPR) repeat protein
MAGRMDGRQRIDLDYRVFLKRAEEIHKESEQAPNNNQKNQLLNQAIQNLERILQQHSEYKFQRDDKAKCYFLKGKVHKDLKEYDAALEAFQWSIEFYSANINKDDAAIKNNIAENWLQCALIYEEQNKFDLVKEAYQKAAWLFIHPSNFKISCLNKYFCYVKLFHIYDNEGNKSKRNEAFDKAKESWGYLIITKDELAFNYLQETMFIVYKKENVNHVLPSNSWSPNIELLQISLVDSSQFDTYYFHALACQHASNHETAIELFDKSIQSSRNGFTIAKSYYERANSHLAKKSPDSESAILDYFEAAKSFPDTLHGRQRKIDCYRKIIAIGKANNKLQAVLNALEELTQLTHNDQEKNDQHTEYAELCQKLNEHQRAIDHINQIISLFSKEEKSPEGPWKKLYYLRAISHYHLNNYHQAIEDFSIAMPFLDFSEGKKKALLFRAASYQALGNHDKAITDCDESLPMSPSDEPQSQARCVFIRAFSLLAQASEDSDAIQDAIQDYTDAVKLDSQISHQFTAAQLQFLKTSHNHFYTTYVVKNLTPEQQANSMSETKDEFRRPSNVDTLFRPPSPPSQQAQKTTMTVSTASAHTSKYA